MKTSSERHGKKFTARFCNVGPRNLENLKRPRERNSGLFAAVGEGECSWVRQGVEVVVVGRWLKVVS